jgi:hypothetical protein
VEGCDAGKPFVVDGNDSPAKEAFLNLTERVIEAMDRK